MTQIAVFVDSGYLFAQGSVLVTGYRQQRRQIRLDVKRVLRALYKVRQGVAPDARLLRAYWYDGVPRGGTTTPQQDEIAMAPYVKLRLGIIKSDGGQKGVDSLIVLDLIELARNRAITDALIVSGDEDIRAGVLVAQNHGVRVHLLSVGPARGSQSPDLVKEADTLTEWQRDDVTDFLDISAEEIQSVPRTPLRPGDTPDAIIETEIGATIATMPPMELQAVIAHIQANPNRIPSDLDRTTLGRIKAGLGRELDDEERKRYRQMFATALRAAVPTPLAEEQQ
jgi:uncharacterized LabA/DUF88 family protein